MPMITANALVISERNVGEHDKFITVLTPDDGSFDIAVRGANKINGKNQAATQLFAYSKMCFSSTKANRDKYYLDSSELIYDFFFFFFDIKKLALACYMGEVAKKAVLASNCQHERDVLRLVLNSLYFLSEDKRSCEFIKSVFELRFMAEIGFIPQLIGCRKCYCFDDDYMYFLVDKACVLCEEHFLEDDCEENYYNIKITRSEFTALQFICLAKMERLFNFKLSDKAQKKVNEITEKYIRCHLAIPIKALNYYNSLD